MIKILTRNLEGHTYEDGHRTKKHSGNNAIHPSHQMVGYDDWKMHYKPKKCKLEYKMKKLVDKKLRADRNYAVDPHPVHHVVRPAHEAGHDVHHHYQPESNSHGAHEGEEGYGN